MNPEDEAIKSIAIEALFGGAKFMENTDWCKQVPRITDKEGKTIAVCLLGALWGATSSTPNIRATQRVAADRIAETAIKKIIGHPMIGNWNDTQCQSKDEAVSVLRKAATYIQMGGAL